MSFELRDYQKQCLEAIFKSYQNSTTRQLVCLPTGTGKTVIFSSFPRYFKMKKKMLVLAHREELLHQAREKILRANPDLKVDLEQAEHRADLDCDVVVASVATLGRKDSKRLARFNGDDFYLIVVDEAHHATAATYLRIFNYLGLLDEGSKKLLVGFTATPKRGDGQGLNKVFQDITYSKSLPEMIDSQYLSPLSGYRVETRIDLSGVQKRMGDYVSSQLSSAVDVEERNDLVYDVYEKYLAPKKVVIFCVDVAHSQSLAQTFEKQDVPVASVTGETSKENRRKILEDFKKGELRVLTNCMVLTEGFDESSIEGIILARPTRSSLLYTQMIGRSTRLHPGKKEALIIDIVDITKDHGLATLPTLFGFSDKFDLQGATTSKVQEALEWVKKHRPWVRHDLALSLEDLRYRCKKINLLELSLPKELKSWAKYAWTTIGKNNYCLNLGKSEALIITLSILGKWEVHHRERDLERLIAQARNLRDAIQRAEYYIKFDNPEVLPLINLKSAWRKSPATEKQLGLISKFKIQVPEEITKGQASHVISMLTIVK